MKLSRNAPFPTGIVLLCALAYANSLRGPFVFDDINEIASNENIRDLAAYIIGSGGHGAVPTRWVGYLTFAVNYRLGGLHVFGYHVVNVLIHAVNALLVYALTASTFQAPRMRQSALSARAKEIGFLAAALFATHPLQTEAVTYVVQRLTSLATLFYLLTVVLYATFRLLDSAPPAGSRAARSVMYGLALVSAAVAMKTKEIAFTLPFTIVLYDLTFFEGTWRRRARDLIPLLSTTLIIPLTLLNVREPIGSLLAGAERATRLGTAMSRVDYFRTQLAVVATYLRLLVLPYGQNIEHDFPVFTTFVEPRVLLSSTLLVVLCAVAAGLFWRIARSSDEPHATSRLVAFGIVWFFVTLSVESSVIPIVDVIYEHRAYLPSIGFFIAVASIAGACFVRFARAPARAMVVTAVLTSVVLGSLTLNRNTVWSNEVALWADSVEKSPLRSRPRINLGTALATSGHFREAAVQLQRAVELAPQSSWARAQLGATLLALGDLVGAEPQLRTALRLKADDPEALFNLALVLSRAGRRDEASAHFKRFLEVAPPAYGGARRFAAAQIRP